MKEGQVLKLFFSFYKNKKTKVTFVASGSGSQFTWTILKLKNTQLWVRDDSDPAVVKEYHFVES